MHLFHIYTLVLLLLCRFSLKRYYLYPYFQERDLLESIPQYRSGKVAFNRVLYTTFFLQEIKRKLGMDVRGEPKKMRRLLTLCERAKRDLSAVMKANIDVENVVIVDELSIGLQRAKFEELIKPLLSKTADIVKSTLDSAKVSVDSGCSYFALVSTSVSSRPCF